MFLNHQFLHLEFDLYSKIHLLWGLRQNLHQLVVDSASVIFLVELLLISSKRWGCEYFSPSLLALPFFLFFSLQ